MVGAKAHRGWFRDTRLDVDDTGDLHTLINALELNDVALGGFSMGGGEVATTSRLSATSAYTVLCSLPR